MFWSAARQARWMKAVWRLEMRVSVLRGLFERWSPEFPVSSAYSEQWYCSLGLLWKTVCDWKVWNKVLRCDTSLDFSLSHVLCSSNQPSKQSKCRDNRKRKPESISTWPKWFSFLWQHKDDFRRHIGACLNRQTSCLRTGSWCSRMWQLQSFLLHMRPRVSGFLSRVVNWRLKGFEGLTKVAAFPVRLAKDLRCSQLRRLSRCAEMTLPLTTDER